jgi:diaminopimelate epimerase
MMVGMWGFAKGHGTGNDFVILPDAAGELPLTPALVAAVCDRQRGIGGDGILRVVRSAAHPDAVAMAEHAEWFMDYWNADGSLAEMCGNGVRVFARYLTAEKWIGRESFAVATRSGVVTVTVAGDDITVDMAVPRVDGASTATVGGQVYAGTVVAAGNPNLVCPVPSVDPVDLSTAPGLDARVFPRSANVEFVAPAGPARSGEVRVRMRVFERGVGETLSCGSGACAAAAVALRDAGLTAGTVVVEVPGGQLSVALDARGCRLSGPAVIVARGEFDPALVG